MGKAGSREKWQRRTREGIGGGKEINRDIQKGTSGLRASRDSGRDQNQEVRVTRTRHGNRSRTSREETTDRQGGGSRVGCSVFGQGRRRVGIGDKTERGGNFGSVRDRRLGYTRVRDRVTSVGWRAERRGGQELKESDWVVWDKG